jgi:Ca-activated chloride channel family protein
MQMETRNRAAIALALACTSVIAAQKPAVFRTSTDVVLVPVSVTDQNGRFVYGLTSADFEIAEDGARRAVKQFSAERVPVSLIILLDISGSMMLGPDARAADDARWADTRRALEALMTRLDAADELLFAVFNDQLAASPWTQDRGRILDAFDALRPGGGTALLRAITEIAPAFRMARHQRKVLLLISDGNDTQTSAAGALPPPPSDIGDLTAHFGDSQRTRRRLVIEGSRNAVRRSDAVLYAIGIGTRSGVPVDINLLDGLTKESGGYTERLRRPSEIAAAVARICDDLQSQYLLTFEPAHADGKYHRIRVSTKDTRWEVRTRAGYISAPGP